MSRVLFTIGLIVATVAVARSETITLSEYLSDVAARHPFFQKERLQVDIERARRDRSLGNRDWVIDARPMLDYQEPVATVAFVPERVYAVGLESFAEKSLWSNGGRVAFGWESGFTDQLLPDIVIPTPTGGMTIPIGPSKFYQHRLSATYSYPILQNRGGILDRLAYELGDFNVLFSEVETLENQESFLLDVASRFLDWAATLEQMSIAEERLRVSKEQLEAVERRRAANLVDEVDVVRSSAAVQDATLSLKRVESLFDAKRAELAVIAQNEEIYRLLPEFDIYRVDSLPRVETAVERIENQRIVSALKVRLEQIAHEKQGLEETGKPQLYLNLIGALQDGDASFERSLGLDKPELGIALEFRHPLGGRTARADVARADFESRQLRREIESVSLSLEAEMRRLLIRIGELVEIMALNREQIETARIKTREELKLYNQGRGELIFVIQSRDDEYLAQLVYALSASQYHQLVLTYRALADELLVQ